MATPLVGGFNVANTLTALGVGLALGLDLERAPSRRWAISGVSPGRMEPVDAGQDFTVLVDYAHTPDSVRNALRTARGFTQGKTHRGQSDVEATATRASGRSWAGRPKRPPTW